MRFTQVAPDRKIHTFRSYLTWVTIYMIGMAFQDSISSPSRVYTSSSIVSTTAYIPSRRCSGPILHDVHRRNLSLWTSNTSWLCIIASCCSWWIISRSSLCFITHTSVWIIARSLSIKHLSSRCIISSRSSKCIITSQPLWVVSRSTLCTVSRPCWCNVTGPSSGSLITSPSRSWTRLSSSRSSCSSTAAATTTSSRLRTTSLSKDLWWRINILF